MCAATSRNPASSIFPSPHNEGDRSRIIAGDKVLAALCEIPSIGERQADKAIGGEDGREIFDNMIGAWAAMDKVNQVIGEISFSGHVAILCCF